MSLKANVLLQNHLLAALPADVLAAWSRSLEPTEIPLGLVLYEAGTTLSHVYFPTTAIVSLLYVMQNGESAEIAVVGNDGLLGVSLFMGGGSTPSRALVQNGGQGFRIDADVVKRTFETSLPVMHLLLRYTQALITQMTQSAACNKHHSLNQQLCRWLLLTLDRANKTELFMTRPNDRQHSGHQRQDHAARRSRVGRQRTDPLLPRKNHHPQPQRVGEAHLRVLCRGARRVRATAAPRQQPAAGLKAARNV